jgi:hypothetical protein
MGQIERLTLLFQRLLAHHSHLMLNSIEHDFGGCSVISKILLFLFSGRLRLGFLFGEFTHINVMGDSLYVDLNMCPLVGGSLDTMNGCTR